MSRARTHAADLNLSNVEGNLRDFILEYRSGSRDIKTLISSESLKTRQHISTSTKETFQALGGIQKSLNGLTVGADVQVDHARRERLLQSLKFPGLNERRNQVLDAYEKTFQWIFTGDDGPSEENLMGSDSEDSNREVSDLEDVDLGDPSKVSWDPFSNWLSSTADFYWISGKPGSGKTTLVKYVLRHPKTAAYLDIWSPRALIISHFFWRPGNKMQQSIKGMLCSLLYQLLENSVAATAHVFQHIQRQSLGSKDAHTDWSVQELRSIVLQTLSLYEHPVCIFIDGLDEVYPKDGALKLLELVDQFSRCRNTKLCLSSRPEPLLQRHLSSYPHLRLQDLTKTDLYRYARDHIKLSARIDDEATSNSSRGPNVPWDPMESIVNKAEGVFLWLVLAVTSINKGFMYGDTSTIIRQRIDNLPGDLTKLYKDMWDRACEDNPEAYHKTAALYFRLIMLDSDGLEFPEPSTLQLMLASTLIGGQLLDAIEHPLNLVPEERMLKECRDLERKLELYCFGLVTITKPSREEKVVGWYGSQYNSLWSCYGRGHAHFIHRTARDFLLDTLQGKEILRHDVSSESSLFFRRFTSHLAISQLYVHIQRKPPQLKVINNVNTYTEILDGKYRELGPCDRNWTRALFYLERLCSSGQLLSRTWFDDKLTYCGGVDFLKVDTSICCHESIWPVAKRRTLTPVMAAQIFLNLCDPERRGNETLKEWYNSNVEDGINLLLSEGTDPNWKGTMFRPEGLFAGKYSQARTPFTAYLEMTLQLAYSLTRFKPYAETLRALHGFLSHSAHLGDMLSLCFEHKHTDDGCTLRCRSLNNAIITDSGTDGLIREYLIVSFPAHAILRALLLYIGKEFEHPRSTHEASHEEIKSMIADIHKHLDDWPKAEKALMIGKFAQSGTELPVWYVPSKDSPAEISDEMIEELHHSMMNACWGKTVENAFHSSFVDQISWTVQAKGWDEPFELLAEIGVLASVDCEFHDIQFWVDRFQSQRSADGSFADGIEVMQSCLGSLDT